MQLSDFNTLAEAHAYNIDILQNADMLREYLQLKGKWSNVMRHTIDTGEPLYSAASGLDHLVNKERPMSFDANTGNGAAQLGLLNLFVSAGDISEEDKANILAMAKNYPFSKVTQAQFNSAKGLFASQVVSYTAGQSITLTLHNDLSESVVATTWLVEDGFADENAGRVAHIKSAQKYRIDMSGKKSGNYEFRVPLLDADFTVMSA